MSSSRLMIFFNAFLHLPLGVSVFFVELTSVSSPFSPASSPSYVMSNAGSGLKIPHFLTGSSSQYSRSSARVYYRSLGKCTRSLCSSKIPATDSVSQNRLDMAQASMSTALLIMWSLFDLGVLGDQGGIGGVSLCWGEMVLVEDGEFCSYYFIVLIEYCLTMFIVQNNLQT